MQHKIRWMVIAFISGGLMLTACQNHSNDHHVEHPAEVEHIDGSEISKVTLTEKAIERLALKTDKVTEQGSKKAVPYSALIYDPMGQTWVYTSPQPRTFVREQVTVERIDGDTAFLSDGPPSGTVVASVGVAVLYGTEFEVGH